MVYGLVYLCVLTRGLLHYREREREERRAPRAAYLEVSGREGAYIASEQMCLRSCSRSSHGTRSIAAGPARSTINYEPTPPSPLSRRRQQRRYRPVFFVCVHPHYSSLNSDFFFLSLFSSFFLLIRLLCCSFKDL